MTLLEPDSPLPPPNPWFRRMGIALFLLLLAGGLLYWQFRFYPEKKKVAAFMDALVAGDYPRAYQIWSPSPSYSFQDFLEDWGETSSWGRIRSYEIVGVEPTRETVLHVPDGGGGRRVLGLKTTESSGVVVAVRINGRVQSQRIWVERKDKSLSFPPF